MWEASHMSGTVRTPLQIALSEAIERAPEARDYYDRAYQQRTGKTGKPIYDIERGESRQPKIETLRIIADVMGLPEEYFVAIAYPTRLASTIPSPSVKRRPSGHGDDVPEQPRVHTVDAGETVGIIRLDLSVAMGPGRSIETFVESDVVSFDLSMLNRITRTPSDRLRFITGVGTSHEPKFQSGDQFLIDLNERSLTRIDGYYWITFEGAYALKRLRPVSGGHVSIISENRAEYEPFEVNAEEITIEGRAIWFARSL